MEDARTDETIEEFVGYIGEAAAEAKSDKFPLGDNDVKVLHSRLLKVFQGRKGLEVTMKSMGVMVDQPRVFLHAKILTDIRPVFSKEADSVDAAVIVHNLRIHFGGDSEHKDFYVALDTSDIQSLREVLERADEKAKCLERLLKKTGVAYLDAKE